MNSNILCSLDFIQLFTFTFDDFEMRSEKSCTVNRISYLQLISFNSFTTIDQII